MSDEGLKSGSGPLLQVGTPGQGHHHQQQQAPSSPLISGPIVSSGAVTSTPPVAGGVGFSIISSAASQSSSLSPASSPIQYASSKGLRRMGSVKKQPFFMNLRIQLIDQLKTLDTRLETQVQLTNEIQEFFKKRAEVEMETSRALEKLAKNLNTRHKEIKAKRDSSSSSSTLSSNPLSTPLLSSSLSQSLSMGHHQGGGGNPPQPWTVFNSQSSLSVCWQQLINDTKIQSQNHAILADIYSTEINQRLQFVSEDLQRIYKQCREIGLEAHEELLKVLHELHTSMKTYHTYQTETRIAEAKLKLVEAQKSKLEQQIPKEKLEKSKKMKLVEKEVQKRMHKFTDARFKSQKAKNEYILCMDAANAAVQKYFMEDLSDLIDCMDLGFYECVTRSLNMYVSSQDQIRKSLQQNMENMSKCISSLDARLDKQKFLESHNTVFALPKKFEYVPPTYPNNKNTASIAEEDFTPDPPEIETSGFIRQELEQRLFQLHKRLETLRMESDELWKTLETAENSLLEMITAKDYDTCAFFIERNNRVVNEGAVSKMRSDKQETDEFHLNKFRDYMLTMNRISRLQSKYEHIRKTLKTSDPTGQSLGPAGSGSTTSAAAIAASTRQYNRRKRIGQIQKFTNTRLFGGSIEEYLEKTNQDIPLVMRSCIRVINLYGLQHQGIFRVSGSQVEINNFKEAFEKGEDPLADVTDASDINSVAGVLKLYLRELREPLFPICYFEQFMELAQLDSNNVFISRMRDLVKSLPRAVFIVLRYLFAFLNHLSEYSDENMMDPYNLAICFGPTLVPVPEDKDQVQYQNLVNELIKNVILFHDEIFVDVPDGIFYEKYISTDDNAVDDDGGGGGASGGGGGSGAPSGSSNAARGLGDSSPLLKKSLSCSGGGGGGGKMTHSRDDSNCSSLGSCGKSEQYYGAVLSEEASKRNNKIAIKSTSPLPNPPLSPVIKETVILDDDDEEEDEDEDVVKSLDIAVFQKKSDFLEAIAQFDFTARSTRELSLKKGETLVLYAQVSSDWWKGANRRGDEGLIPDKYILLKIRDEDLPAPASVVPPPLTTPPSSSSASSSQQQQQNKPGATTTTEKSTRGRTASDSLITTPMGKSSTGSSSISGSGGQPGANSDQTSSSGNNHHQRSFSVSDDRASKSTGSSTSSIISTKGGSCSSDAADNSRTNGGGGDVITAQVGILPIPQQKVTVLTTKSGSSPVPPPVVPDAQKQQKPEQEPGDKEGSSSTTAGNKNGASPLVVVKSNIQFWEQRLKPSDSPAQQQQAPQTTSSSSSSSSPQPVPIITTNTAPDLVMDLPQNNNNNNNINNSSASPAQSGQGQSAPVPPKFTDTSPSSSDESDSSESSNNSSASSSPSTPTRVGSSGAEVFAKQKNATLKKRTQGDGQVGPSPNTVVVQPTTQKMGGGGGGGAQQQASSNNPPWGGSSGGGGSMLVDQQQQRTTMFTFSSTFNKPQVKVKPVVLSKPKLPFTLNKMDEDCEESADHHHHHHLDDNNGFSSSGGGSASDKWATAATTTATSTERK